ncbi:MAG: hypothetical protein BWY08_02085 [Bacteroidetes bacterium ADurb.Bin174]|nr:MAG: hypothetical protein BWY08_02085 [Bacteroidetes bacterium ADurb.Bin174]
MKKLFILLSVALCATSMTQGAVGDTFTAGGIEYLITSETPAEVAVGANAEFTGTSVDIPASVVNGGTTYAVTAVGHGDTNTHAFANVSSLTSVKLLESIKTISGHAFRESGLTTITIPHSVETISGFVCFGCKALTSVEIGNGVKVIDGFSFEACSNLKSVKIGTGLTTMNYVFYNCPLLKDVTCLAATPPIIDAATFGGTTPIAAATLSVPSGSISAYQGADVWKDFGTIKAYTPTSVGAVAESGVTLQGGKGSLLVTAPSGTPAAVFTVTGSKVFEKTLSAGTHSIALQPGAYIVKAGNKKEKIVVR